MSALQQNLAEAYGLSPRETRGAVHVASVNEDEPADIAGIAAYDIVVGTNGVALEDDQDFLQRIAMTPPHETIVLDIVRITPDASPIGLTGESTSIAVTLGERKPEIEVLADSVQQSTGIALGRDILTDHDLTAVEERFDLVLSELDRNLASELEYRASDGGIVILRAGVNSPIGRVPEGTIIQKVNLRPTNTIEAFSEIIDHFAPEQMAVLDLRLPTGGVFRVPIEIPE